MLFVVLETINTGLWIMHEKKKRKKRRNTWNTVWDYDISEMDLVSVAQMA